MSPIRRLPVLQDASTSDDERPPWHWVFIGAAFAVSIWAPLAVLASWAGAHVVARVLGEAPSTELAERMQSANLHDRLLLWLALPGGALVTFLFSCTAAGALVGRFGGRAGPKEAAGGGVLAALAGAGLTLARASSGAAAAALAVLLPLGFGAGWLGGRFGLRRRVASVTRSPPPP